MLREEREAAARDIALLRADLDNTRGERERAMADVAQAKADLERWVPWAERHEVSSSSK